MSEIKLPLPNDYIYLDGENMQVVASTFQTDDTGVLICLRHKPPYYYVAEISLYTVHSDHRFSKWFKKFPNIIPAAEFYQQQTGCY